jgi:hypothetical protein
MKIIVITVIAVALVCFVVKLVYNEMAKWGGWS